MKRKTLYWTLAAGLQLAVSFTDPLCIYGAAVYSREGVGIQADFMGWSGNMVVCSGSGVLMISTAAAKGAGAERKDSGEGGMRMSKPVKTDHNQEDTINEKSDEMRTDMEMDRLKHYLSVTRKYESTITGESPSHISDIRLIVSDKSSNDLKISTIINQIPNGKDATFYIIGKNYKPNGILVAEWLGQHQDGEYSSTTETVITIGADIYTVVRMSVCRQAQEKNCFYLWDNIRVEPGIKADSPGNSMENSNPGCSRTLTI